MGIKKSNRTKSGVGLPAEAWRPGLDARFTPHRRTSAPSHTRTDAPTHSRGSDPQGRKDPLNYQGRPFYGPGTMPEGGWLDGEGSGEGRAGGLHKRGAEIDDEQHRRAYPSQALRSTYLALVGENPDVGAGDHASASAYVRRIDEALERGGWTRGEWARLYAKREMWARRASGWDPRFEVVGNRSGGVTPGEQARIRMLRDTMILREIRETLEAGW